MREFFEGLFVVVVFVVLVGGGLFGLAYAATAWDCAGYQKATGKQTQLSAGSCYVQDGGQWYAWEEYKNRFVANGVKLK